MAYISGNGQEDYFLLCPDCICIQKVHYRYKERRHSLKCNTCGCALKTLEEFIEIIQEDVVSINEEIEIDFSDITTRLDGLKQAVQMICKDRGGVRLCHDIQAHAEHIGELSKRIDSNEYTQKSLSNRVESQSDLIAQLSSDTWQCTDRNEQIQKQVDQLIGQITELEKPSERIHDRLDESCRQIQALESFNTDLKNQLRQLSDRIQYLEGKAKKPRGWFQTLLGW